MSLTPSLQEIEAFLHHKIPITHAMGVRVEKYDGDVLVLTAPLEANHNHLGTAFGGSLGALATLAGYGMLWLHLADRESHIVIRSSSINYRHPVRDTLRAICRVPADAEITGFKNQFGKAGKARISLPVTVEEAGRVCVEFEGVFVAVR